MQEQINVILDLNNKEREICLVTQRPVPELEAL